jgi:hypothetical protein
MNPDLAYPELIGTTAPPYPVRRADVRAIPLRGGRWRVTRESGAILGYVEIVETEAGRLWRSSRLAGAAARFLPIGDFTSPEDALDVVRRG